MSNISVDYDILNQKQTPAFYASSLATRPAFGFPGRIFIDTDTPSSGIYRDTGSAWIQVADPGAGTTGTLQQVTTNGNTTTLGIVVQGININDGAGTGLFNTAVGTSALLSNTTGASNTSIGNNTLSANTTGSNNIALGGGALALNTTGSNNISIGFSALLNNTTGGANTGIGYNSLLANTTGGNNTALGSQTLKSNTTASFNTAIGNNSLNLNTTGANNTAVGYANLIANTTGDNNTSLGSNSLGANTTGSGNTAIGFNSLVANTTGGNNVAIGYVSLNSNTTASNNTAIGVNTLSANTTGSLNTAIGYASMLYNSTGASNTGIGVYSLGNNTTGNNNSALGVQSLYNNTTGANNVAIGYQSLNANTTGSTNTAVGTSALASNTTAGQNTAIGNSALTTNTTGATNTAIGQGSLQLNTTGNNNTAIGVSSLNANTTGLQNTGIGAAALSAITTGSNNTAIGYASGGAITTGSNNTIIGEYVGTTTLASNIVLADGLGNVRLFSDANGLIGINQAVGSVPGGQLDIHTTQTYALVLNGLSTSNAYTAFSNNSVGKWRIGNTYNAGANSFDIYNLGTSSNALSFNSTTNAGTFIGQIKTTFTGQSISINAAGTGSVRMQLQNNNIGNAGVSVESSTGGDQFTGTTAYAMAIGTYTARDFFIGTNGVQRLNISSTGNVGIGNTGAANIRLYITSQDTTSANFAIVAYNSSNEELLLVRNDGLYLLGTKANSPYNYNVTFAPRSAGLDASGGLGYIVSTRESKGNIESIKNIDFVNKLNPVKFNYRKKNKDNTEFIDELHEDIYFGFIADEVEQINKDLVFYDNLQDGSKKLAGVHYNSIIAILTKSIQELNEKVDRLYINHYGQ